MLINDTAFSSSLLTYSYFSCLFLGKRVIEIGSGILELLSGYWWLMEKLFSNREILLFSLASPFIFLLFDMTFPYTWFNYYFFLPMLKVLFLLERIVGSLFFCWRDVDSFYLSYLIWEICFSACSYCKFGPTSLYLLRSSFMWLYCDCSCESRFLSLSSACEGW